MLLCSSSWFILKTSMDEVQVFSIRSEFFSRFTLCYWCDRFFFFLQEYPEAFFKPYAQGPGYLLTAPLAEIVVDFYLNQKFERSLRMDDVVVRWDISFYLIPLWKHKVILAHKGLYTYMYSGRFNHFFAWRNGPILFSWAPSTKINKWITLSRFVVPLVHCAMVWNL